MEAYNLKYKIDASKRTPLAYNLKYTNGKREGLVLQLKYFLLVISFIPVG
jgi:hypothetical protein